MKYEKPFLSFDEQVDRIITRGMIVDDRERAMESIQRIGYYRLSAYWYHWRLTDDLNGISDQYHPAASFSDSVSVYSFDRQLRLLLLDAIERVEIALRVAIAHIGGARDPFIHMSMEHLGEYARRVDTRTGCTPFAKFTQRCNEAYERSSEDFVKHCKAKYESGPAIWVHIETWDFGLLSNFYKLLPEGDQIDVANVFGVNYHSMFESWIASLNYVRNLCAHHSRLFRRSLVVKPGTRLMREIDVLAHVRDLVSIRGAKLYPVLAILLYLMEHIAPESAWNGRLIHLLDEFPDTPTTSLADYGFPDDWRSQSLWLTA